ncbi:hypothetical protein [Brevundimonas sp.]|uniref:hypothetical protein n=1 Tax=Brevundimonas sp. TaxID=1871086 RepID=UPI002ABD0FA8|nr:hypothetical protein [Brevundimonas sp.]MDZ4362113.1 hypothetical protein [Brevundimonas sp.]
MAAKNGAGASVSSGASYQARVGAYALVTALCDFETELTARRSLQSASFETTEAVDDINIKLEIDGTLYLHSKAKVDYSLRADGALRSVLEQFSRQSRTRGPNDQYILVTGSRSSNKITFDMRAALDAFRAGDDNRFRNDQPKALVEIIDDLLRVLGELRASAGLSEDREDCASIVRQTYVHVLDIEAGDALEQAIILLLQTQHFAAPSAVWGKIVSDCVSHSKVRRTIKITDAKRDYSRYQVTAGKLPEAASDDLIQVEFGQLDVAVGREVVLGWVSLNGDQTTPSERMLALIEFYRFDEDCNERIRFEDGKCILGNGMEVELIRRASTFVGMERMIEREPGLLHDQALTLFPFNGDDDLEAGLCATTHLAKVRKAALANPNPMHCLHCGRPVSSTTASMVEVGTGEELLVGLSHQQCLEPEDRVLGAIKSEFFEEHLELVNFDPNAWFRAIHNGQRTFSNAEEFRGREIVLGWGGKRSSVLPGNYVVEMLLRGGGREIVTVRNGVHRFSKPEAEQFADRLNSQMATQGITDPYCYTDESKAFGTKSFLVPKFGGKEKIVPVERARARPYDERFAARYSRPGSWYAPLLFLRSVDDGEPVRVLTAVALLTDPLTVGNFLENWREAGLELTHYEIVSLLTDEQFDDFMCDMAAQKLRVVVDPLIASAESTSLISGIEIRSISDIAGEQ